MASKRGDLPVDLNGEGVSLSDLEVVGELEVLGEGERVHGGDDSVRLEVVHRERVLRVDDSSNELGEHVERDLNSGDRGDDSNRDDEDDAEEDTEEDWQGEGIWSSVMVV